MKAIIDIAARRGAHNVRAFGSVARGDDTADSEVDLLVDLDKGVALCLLLAEAADATTAKTRYETPGPTRPGR